MRAKDRKMIPPNEAGKDGDKKDGDTVDPQLELLPKRAYVSIHPNSESDGDILPLT